jgi:hypothetical protein
VTCAINRPRRSPRAPLTMLYELHYRAGGRDQ